MKYRVYSSREDITEHVYCEFNEENDSAAKKKFDAIAANPNMAWERLSMVCVEQVEKTRPVAVNDVLQRVLDS